MGTSLDYQNSLLYVYLIRKLNELLYFNCLLQEVIMATNYEKILTSIGTLYRNTDRSNKQERLRLLSTVALHAPNETLKRFFQRLSKRDDVVSVNEAEIVQAREYAKQFGPGTHVMPVGQGESLFPCLSIGDFISRCTNSNTSSTCKSRGIGSQRLERPGSFCFYH